MFDPFSTEDAALKEAVASAFADLKSCDAHSEEYRNIVQQLKELYALQHKTASITLEAQTAFADHQLAADKNAWAEEQDQRPFWKRVDPNTVAAVAGNLAVALLVVKYEQTGVIASKVGSFIRKI